MASTNTFGGGNANSLYTPMSELEQEVVSRLVESGDLQVFVVGWGVVSKVKATFGDLRVSIPLVLHFDRPETPMAVPYFDLELRTASGILLFRDRQPTIYGGSPVMIMAGMSITMVWDIAIKAMDPNLVKLILPGAIGLTSRLQDRDTGELSLVGNMKLSHEELKLLRTLRAGEQAAKENTAARLSGLGK